MDFPREILALLHGLALQSHRFLFCQVGTIAATGRLLVKTNGNSQICKVMGREQAE